MTDVLLQNSALCLQFTSSGYCAFSVARDDIIRQAMLNHALLEPSEIPTAQEITDCARVLNMIVKQLAGQLDRAPGFKMWQRYRGELFLSYSQYLYNLAGNVNGDQWAGGVTGLKDPYLFNQDQLVAPVVAGSLLLSVGPIAAPVATKHIHAVFLRESMDFNNPGDAPEFPQEWFWHLSWMLTLGICSMFDCDWTQDKQLAFGLATTNAREGNPETTAAYFQPENDDMD